LTSDGQRLKRDWWDFLHSARAAPTSEVNMR